MWAGISGLITLIVMSIKAWLEYQQSKQEKFNADKQAISDAVSSGDISRINAIVQRMQR